MQHLALPLAAATLFALCVLPLAAAKDKHPAEQVISLLKNLDKQVKAEHEKEEITFAKFETWCSSSIRTLKKAVETEKEEIDSLEDKVNSKMQEISTLKTQISDLADEIAKNEASKDNAVDARKEAAALYSTTDADLAATIEAISQALEALTSAKTTTSAFVQSKLTGLLQFPLVLEQLTNQQREELASSLAHDADAMEAPVKEDVLAKGDAASHERKYSFKSGNVIELLKELKRKFEDDRVDATKGETNAQNAFELMMSDLEAALANAAASKEQKETSLGEATSALTEAETSLASVQADLEADSETLETTTTTCRQKSGEWADRTKMRENERKAIGAAVEILEKVTGVRSEVPKNTALPTSPISLVARRQLTVASRLVDPKARAITLLREEARRAHSKVFTRFVEDVAARVGGPFDDVNNMIQKMIFRLMAEQKDEDDHKNWCDLEVEKTNASKAEKSSKIAEYEAKLEDMKAKVTLLMEEIAESDEMVATIVGHMKEATEIREEGKSENKQAIEDAKKAQAALAQASAVIRQFYKESGKVPEASSFAQRGVDLPDEPSTWDASYTGVSDPAEQPDGILTVLERVSADFAKMEADTSAQEVMDQKAYQEDMKQCEIEKTRRSKESQMKGEEKKRLLDKISSTQKSMKSAHGQLEAAEQYLKDLRPACLEGDSTYEERKAARSSEISSLKEAQVILANASEESPTTKAAASFLAPIKPASHK